MRTAGEAVTWPDHATEHIVRFYYAESRLFDEVVEFASEALDSGGGAILIATRAHLAAMAPRLAERASSHDGASDAGSFVSIDAQEALAGFMVDGWPEETRFFATIGGLIAKARTSASAKNGPARVYGEMVTVLCAMGQFDAALRVEALWNALARQHSFTLFCAYPHGLFQNAEQSRIFERICRAHTRVLPSEVLAHAKKSDTQRLIAQWQQKASALEVEVERRREAEAALCRRERELVDFVMNAPVAAALLGGPEHVFRLANRCYRELAGCDAPIGRTYAEVCTGEQQSEIVDLLTKTYECGRSSKLEAHHLDMTRPDGAFEPRYFTFHFEPLRSDGDTVDGVIVNAVEVTEQIRTRDRFEKSHAERERLVLELERASRAKDEFLAMLGHELRNPLAPIVTALQLMRMHPDAGTLHEQGIIQRQVDHLVRLVDDLLDISRITRGKIELKKRTVRVADVLMSAVEMASLLLEQRHHELRVDVEPDLVWTVDGTRVAQVVSNLLTNAARYTAVGGEVRLAARRESPGIIAVSVRDTGRGIPKKMLPRVFDLFYQGRRSLDRAEGGLGIGLALVKSLVEMHGGTVSVESAGPGRGSEFTIHVPVAPSTCEGGATSEGVAREASRAKSPAPNRHRVLLVDDNIDGVEALALLLSECGHQVKAVYDPASALQIVRRFQPEIAVIDIGLPVMDGYQLIGRLREALAGRACLFIALTGYGQDVDRSRSRAAGFDHHVVKPVDPSQLLRLIAELPVRT
jgi:signal transduction histidine kinase